MKITAIAFLALSGCSIFTNNNALQATEYTCASASALLKAAIAANANPTTALSAANNGHVTHAVSILNPVCSQQAVPTLDSTAQAALQSALAELTAAVPAAPPVTQ